MRSKSIDALLRQSLTAAYIAHLTKLFNVLMSEPTEASYERFRTGVKISIEMYSRIEKDVDQWLAR